MVLSGCGACEICLIPMKNAIIAIVGFAAMGVFIALAQKRGKEESLLPQDNWPKDTGQASTDDEVKRLVAAGEKIEAIKLYREIHGCGLKEAKDAVDNMASHKAPGA